MYKVKLETFNGSVRTIDLPTKNSVEEFIAKYPQRLPLGVAIRVACDALSISGTLVGKAKI